MLYETAAEIAKKSPNCKQNTVSESECEGSDKESIVYLQSSDEDHEELYASDLVRDG